MRLNPDTLSNRNPFRSLGHCQRQDLGCHCWLVQQCLRVATSAILNRVRDGALVAGLLAAILCSSAIVAQAAKVETWRHDNKAAFEKAKLDGLLVGRDGQLTLRRQISDVADLDCGLVWDLVQTADGRLIAAASLPGKVVEISGKSTNVIWEHAEQQAFALAALADGSVLVGTGPQGTIYRVAPDGESSVFYQSDALYVWDLVLADDGTIYAATGPDGKVYKIAADGSGDVVCDTGQPHVLKLALAPGGTLIAGTDGAGLVLAIDPDGTSRVLYDTAEGEVRSLWVDPSGVVYAGTAAAESSGDSSTARTASRATSDKPADNSVYRIEPSGAVRKVLGLKALMHSLGRVGRGAESDVLAGTGDEGILYTLDELGRGEQQLARFDSELVLSMLADETGRLFVGTGNPGKVYALEPSHSDVGTLVSEPLDAKLLAHFGAITWRAQTPEGTQVALSVRSGNTQEPDASWSRWSVEQTASPAQADCPPGRFLQYRLSLRTSDPRRTPTVYSVSARYQTANQPPQLTGLTVPHVEEGDGKKQQTSYKIEWAATDPNNDELTYRLSFRKADWRDWVVLAEDLTATSYDWDITSVPEGTYQVAVEVSDARSNPPEAAMTDRIESEYFAVDRDRPTVTARLLRSRPGGQATFEATVEDTMTPIVSAAYSLDSRDWINLFPLDGLFDSTSEQFRFGLTGLTPGTHVLVIRSTDAAGHTGSTDVVFEIQAPEAVNQAAE